MECPQDAASSNDRSAAPTPECQALPGRGRLAEDQAAEHGDDRAADGGDDADPERAVLLPENQRLEEGVEVEHAAEGREDEDELRRPHPACRHRLPDQALPARDRVEQLVDGRPDDSD
eukprot:CAMPEP_0177598430 /NCGR_PEP_ID=MMETSP0419_2-20121207/12346_1 /TAXON_ID=582737 /ORGANISM="Tetraselmis sp., Strain GSL018" /LENGTH=117 /DNA_ID=CAMNT_0019090877 /DNA_START=122 /DNA_END=475 /DNA_ORIENTATION=-